MADSRIKEIEERHGKHLCFLSLLYVGKEEAEENVLYPPLKGCADCLDESTQDVAKLLDEVKRLEDKKVMDDIADLDVLIKSGERIAKLEAVRAAAKGLSFGMDWNKGTHCEIYRPQLLRARHSKRDSWTFVYATHSPTGITASVADQKATLTELTQRCIKDLESIVATHPHQSDKNTHNLPHHHQAPVDTQAESVRLSTDPHPLDEKLP